MVNRHIHIIPDHLNLMDFEDDEMQAAIYEALVDAINTSNNTDQVILEEPEKSGVKKEKKRNKRK